MRVKQFVMWGIAVSLAAAAAGLLHGLLGVLNPLLGSAYFDLLFFSAFCIALAHAVFIGVPVALLYRARGWTNLIAVAIGGFLIGILPYSIFALIALSPAALQIELIAMFGGYGALGALVFWFALSGLEVLDSRRDRPKSAP
jgi:hypothetical protein